MWGSAGVFVRTLADAGLDSSSIVLTRQAFGTLMVLALILVTDRRLLRVSRRDVPLMIACALSLTGLNILYTEAVKQTTLSLAAVLISMAPVFMVVLARITFGERITRRKALCILAAVTGCVLVSGVLEESQEVSDWGVAAGLTSALCYALFGLLSKRSSSRGYSSYTTLFWSMLIASIILLPLSDLGSIGSYASKGLPELGLLVLHGAFCSFLPNLFYTIAFTRLEAGTVSILAAAGEPAAATVFGTLVYSETPTPLMAAGIVLAIIAIAVMCSPEKEQKLDG